MNLRVLLYILTAGSAVLGCSGPTGPEEQNKDIVLKAFAAAAAADYAGIDTLFTEAFVRHSQATPDIRVNSLEEFKDFIRQDHIACPDQQIRVEKLIAEGDYVAFWAVYSATQSGPMGSFPPSNKHAELDFSGYHKVVDGKIAESWLIWDNVAFLSQLGYFPPPSPADQPE